MIQVEFANRARTILETNEDVVGLAVGGSWLTNQIDEYSDLDLILVTKNKISSDKNQMTLVEAHSPEVALPPGADLRQLGESNL